MVSNEIPLDTTAAFQETQSASKTVLDSAININNLEPLAFLNSSGSAVSTTDFYDLEKHPANITFSRFRCNMDGSAVNSYVGALGLSFVFFLKLPLYEYDSSSKTTPLVSTPLASVSKGDTGVGGSLTSCFTASGTSIPSKGSFSSGPSIPSSFSGSDPGTITSPFSSHKMKIFMVLRTTSTGTKRGYCDACDFWIIKMRSYNRLG